MQLDSLLVRRSPIHYGWIILAAGTLGAFMTTPGQTIGISAFLDPMTADLGISRTGAAFAYTVGTLAGVLPAPLIGRWIDGRGPQVAGTAIAILLALACVGMALVTSSLTLLIGFAALRGSAVGGLSLVSQHMVNLWFVQRRGIAAAGTSLGLAAGGIVFPRLIEWLVQLHGWRGAFLALGAIVAMTIVPTAALLFRDRPERFGVSLDVGWKRKAGPVFVESTLTRGEALRTRLFWLLSATSFLSNALGTGLLLNHFSVMAQAGLERVAALALLAPIAAIQALATLLTGAAVDQWEPRRILPVPMLAMSVALGAVVIGHGMAFGWPYAAALGISLGSNQAIGAAVYARYFGRDHLGSIRGASFVISIFGAACGPLPFALSFAWRGDYAAVLAVSAAICLVCAAGSWAIRPPVPAGRER